MAEKDDSEKQSTAMHYVKQAKISHLCFKQETLRS